jgi:hypothetical protein
MNWIEINYGHKPPRNRALICYCPKWCDSGYQVAAWDGKKFRYEDQPNDNFDQHVEQWALFLEAA